MGDLGNLQKRIDNILQGYEKPYWSPLSNVARLVEEVGQVAKVDNYKYEDKAERHK